MPEFSAVFVHRDYNTEQKTLGLGGKAFLEKGIPIGPGGWLGFLTLEGLIREKIIHNNGIGL
jgi:hypothetical protein